MQKVIHKHTAEQFLTRVEKQIHRLKVNVSFWDATGSLRMAQSLSGEFCQQICYERKLCFESIASFARKVVDQMQPSNFCDAEPDEINPTTSGLIATCPIGCYLLGIPIWQRRRLTGVAVACFPTVEMHLKEQFIRFCNQARLDAKLVSELSRKKAIYSFKQAECLWNAIAWMIRDEQAKQTANEELTSLSTNLANTYEELALLYTIGSSMKLTHSPEAFFQNICEEIIEVLQIEAAAVILYPHKRSQKPETLSINTNHDTDDKNDATITLAGNLPITKEEVSEISRRYIRPRISKFGSKLNNVEPFVRALIENHFDCPITTATHANSTTNLIRSFLATPLITSEHYRDNHNGRFIQPSLGKKDALNLRGILIGFNKIGGEFDSADAKLISFIGEQASVFLENHSLYDDLQDLLMGVLHALTASVDAKDPYTCGHSHRVALISRKIAQLAEFDSYRTERIYLAGLLHDIGKIGIPETLLRKTGKLSTEEYQVVQKHPQIGATILKGIRQMSDVIPAILHHHERPDGRGYPSGLRGKQIPIEALIVGLADSFDAMTSSRTYRGTMPLEVVATEIRRYSGTQFDPRLSELLLSLNLEDFLAEIRSAKSPWCKVYFWKQADSEYSENLAGARQ